MVMLERVVTEHQTQGNHPHLVIITVHPLLMEMGPQIKEDPMVHQIVDGIHPHHMEMDLHHLKGLKIFHLMATDKEVLHRQEICKEAPLHPSVTAYHLHGPETDHQIEDQMGQTQIQTFHPNVNQTHHLNVCQMHHLSVCQMHHLNVNQTRHLNDSLMHHLNINQMNHLNINQMHHLNVNLIILLHNANVIILPHNKIRDQISPHLKITLHNNKDNLTTHPHNLTLSPIYRQTRRQQTPVLLALKFHQ